MARKTTFLEITGPLFDAAAQRRVNDAIAEGLEELGDTAAGILAGFVSQGGFVHTGAFLSSIDAQRKGSDDGGVGYVKVAPTDVWPAADRPTRTWFEKGTRKGVKYRKGIGGFSKTTTRVKGMSYSVIEDKIAAVLE